MAKRYFAEHGVSYREVDVATDRKAQRDMVHMTGQHGVPVIRIGGRAIVGWSVAEFERLRRDPRGRR